MKRTGSTCQAFAPGCRLEIARADLLIFQTVADFGGNTTSTADCFLDFGAAQENRLHLSAIDANANTAANDEFTFIGTTAFSGVAGQLRYFQQAATPSSPATSTATAARTSWSTSLASTPSPPGISFSSTPA